VNKPEIRLLLQGSVATNDFKMKFNDFDQLFETAQIAGRSTIIQNDSAAQHLITY
jgi:hypothetical protein